MLVWEGEGCILKALTWVGIQFISPWLWIMNLSPGSLSCSLILTISLGQELFRWENRAMGKSYNLSRTRQVELLHGYVSKDSRSRPPLWRGEEPSDCQASFFHWTLHTYSHTHTHTHTYAPSISPRTGPEFSILYFSGLKKGTSPLKKETLSSSLMNTGQSWCCL